MKIWTTAAIAAGIAVMMNMTSFASEWQRMENGEVMTQDVQAAASEQNNGKLVYDYDENGLNREILKVMENSKRENGEKFTTNWYADTHRENLTSIVTDNGLDTTRGQVHYSEGFTVNYISPQGYEHTEGTVYQNEIMPDKGMENWVFQYFKQNINSTSVPAYLESLGFVDLNDTDIISGGIKTFYGGKNIDGTYSYSVFIPAEGHGNNGWVNFIWMIDRNGLSTIGCVN